MSLIHTVQQFCNRRFKPEPVYNLSQQLARSLHLADIEKSELELEKMRVREIEKRQKLALALERLDFETQTAKFKLEVRMLDGGNVDLDVHFDAVKDAETVLMDEIENIYLAEIEIEDAKRTLNDPACWTDEMGPYLHKAVS